MNTNRVFTPFIQLMVALALLLSVFPYFDVTASPLTSEVVINEIDYDQPSSDTAEFIEIKNNSASTINLDNYSLDLINGTGGGATSYKVIDLPDVDLAAGDYYVVCGNPANVPNCDLDASPDQDLVQNGAPDAVALLLNSVIIDTVSYEGNTGVPYTEGSGEGLLDDPATAGMGISRCADGKDTDQNNVDFGYFAITPGTKNACGGPEFIINEIDADTPSTDSAEFLELYDGGVGSATLDGLVLVFYNGADDLSYRAFDLDGYVTDASGYFVLCGNAANVANCDLDVTPDTDLIQNGADAVALYTGNAADFPNGTPVTTANLVDAIVYDTDDADDAELLVLLNPAQPQVNENGGGSKDTQSSQRCPNGEGGARNTSTYGQFIPTPGSENCTSIPDNCGDPATLVHEIQGSGTASPKIGEKHSIEGYVVGDFQSTTTGLSGFFLQEEPSDYDGDSSTSEGIFVYDSGFGVDVSPGQLVRVKGEVAEYYDLTELKNVTNVAVCNTEPAVLSPTSVTLPVTALTDWERWEGMLITLPQTLYATDNYTWGRYGEVELSVNDRLYAPTQIAEPGAPALAQQDINNRSRIQLDDGSTVQNPLPFPPYLGQDNTLRLGDTVTGVTGVLSYGFESYEVHPTQTVTFTRVNQRHYPPAMPVGVNVKITSMNLLNYFTTLDTGANICGPAGNLACRGANTAEEFSRQRSKIISAFGYVDPDIAGVLELENNATTAIQDLVNGLNNTFGAGTYTFIDTGTIGTDAIRVALIYKPAKVSPVGAFKILDSTVDPNFLDTKNRPSLAQTFQTPGGKKFTVVVNHFKSKGSDCNDVGDPDTGDGQGNCNLTRTKAANALINWLATDPTGSGDLDFLIIGDLNSYAREDPIEALKSAGFVNVAESLGHILGGPPDYSYVFQGQSGTLDYVFASPSVFTQIPYDFDMHVNADEPTALDYNDYNQPGLYAPDVCRYADHDPILITLSNWELTRVGDELRIFYEADGISPQYAVLHLNDSYFRMNYGPTSGWGTSLVLMPAFWSGGVYYQGAPVTATYQVNQDKLELNLSGEIQGLQVSIKAVISPPEQDKLSTKVYVTTSGTVALDDRPGEAFKPVFLSSMHISDTEWDTRAAVVDGSTVDIPTQGWLIPPTPPTISTAFSLLGGSSAWKQNAPTIKINMNLPIQVAGWVTQSTDPNDDNVGLWAASDQVMATWDYTVTAENGNLDIKIFLPIVVRQE